MSKEFKLEHRVMGLSNFRRLCFSISLLSNPVRVLKMIAIDSCKEDRLKHNLRENHQTHFFPVNRSIN